jgi:hypothetical protein
MYHLNNPVKHNSNVIVESKIDFTDLSQWKTLRHVANNYSQFSLDQLRYLCKYRESNGLAKYCKKVGKTTYIHVPGLSVWISEK